MNSYAERKYNRFFLSLGTRSVGRVMVMAASPPTEVPRLTFKYGPEAAQYHSQRSEDHTVIQKPFPRMSSSFSSQRAFRNRTRSNYY